MSIIGGDNSELKGEVPANQEQRIQDVFEKNEELRRKEELATLIKKLIKRFSLEVEGQDDK